VIAVAGPPWVFMLNALSFIGVLLVVAAWRAPRRVDHVPLESLAGATRAALRYGANAPLLRGILARTVAFIFPAAALQALLPTVVREELGLGSGWYGVLLACFGVGAASGAIAPRASRRDVARRDDGAGELRGAGALLVTGLVHRLVGGVESRGGGLACWPRSRQVAARSPCRWVRAPGLGLFLLAITGGIAIGSALWGGWPEERFRRMPSAAAAMVVGSASTRVEARYGRWARPHPRARHRPAVALMPHPTDGPSS
jgi:hypothetical protein